MRKTFLNKTEMYCFHWNYINSNMYVFLKNGKALVIDPVDTDETRKFWSAQVISKVLIVLTHEHFDHIYGVNWLKENFTCEVIANRICSVNITSESKNLSNKIEAILMFNQEIKEKNISIQPFVCSADFIFDDKLNLFWQNHYLELLTAPGHTEGSILIIFDKKYLFTGDTLLDILTITKLPGGSKKRFKEITLPLLRSMKSYIYQVYPGHGKCNTLENMLQKYEK